MLHMAAFTGGIHVPAARFRIRQYIKGLKAFAIQVTEYASSVGAYPPRNKCIRPLWAMANILSQTPKVTASHCYDGCLLQREMLSKHITLEPFTVKPRILDVDDAIWLTMGHARAARLAQICEAVICGNSYIADFFAKWNKNIVILPTPVDTDLYMPLRHSKSDKIIGWSGTSGGFPYLYAIEAALQRVLSSVPDARLRIVADRRPIFKTIGQDKLEYMRWSPANEVKSVAEMSVGIMPLLDSPWEKGKCSYKMLLYMACGVPVVVSPVGMNVAVLAQGHCGLAASTEQEWHETVGYLINHPDVAVQMGQTGREIVATHYSLHSLLPKFAGILLGSVKK
jgi:glycosyltransferase involved in cell wall biosynthesis